jgi:hypothetical protein
MPIFEGRGVQCVTHEQFRRALYRAAAGIGIGLAFRYDAR